MSLLCKQDLAPPFTCHSRVVRERSLPRTLATWGWWDNWSWGQESRTEWPCPLPAAVLRRAGPAPLQDSSIELTLLEVGHRRAGPEGVRAGEMALPSLSVKCCLDWGKDTPPRNLQQRKRWPWGHKNGRAGPYPHPLQHSGELALHLARGKKKNWAW